MICPNCQRSIPDQNTYCNYCGTAIPRVDKAPKQTRKLSVKWIFLGVILLLVGGFTIYSMHARAKHEQVKDSYLAGLVRLIQENADDIIAYLDASINSSGRTYSNEEAARASVDSEMNYNSIVRDSIDVNMRYHDLSSRKHWDSDKFRAYEELYAAYQNLYQFLDEYYEMDQETQQTTFENLVREYKDCLKKVS